MIVIGDVHGCYYTLMNLMNTLPYTDNICFVGDLIDRGSNSKQVIQFIIKEGYKSVLGNHEDFIKDEDLWIVNGGWHTLQSFNDKDGIDCIENFKNSKEKVWLESLPLIIEWEEFMITHSYAYNGCNTPVDDILWGRDFSISPTTTKINIFGHTPSRDIKIVHGNYCIDTGCVFGYHLSAIDLKTMKTYSEKLDIRDKIQKG